MYSHIMGSDVDLWDIVEEGVQFQKMDADGVISSANRKVLTNEENELYKMHHRAKSMWDSLCSTYGKKIQDGVLEEILEEEVANRTLATKEVSDKISDD
ncbi:TNP1, partial [Trifolium medium]|nr:TNP1 [Trifolium medium]